MKDYKKPQRQDERDSSRSEITAGMVAAGLTVFSDHDGEIDTPAETVARIYAAMDLARQREL